MWIVLIAISVTVVVGLMFRLFLLLSFFSLGILGGWEVGSSHEGEQAPSELTDKTGS